MSHPYGDSVPALLTRRGSGTVIYAIGFGPVSFKEGQSLNEGANGIQCVITCPLTPSLLVPGDGPAAPGDLQWMLCPAPGDRAAAPGHGGGAPGAEQRALSVPVHPELCAQRTPELVHGTVTGAGWNMQQGKLSIHNSVKVSWGREKGCDRSS